jgi:RNA polymerase sigma-B factor
MHDQSTGQTERGRIRADIIELNLPTARRLAHRYSHRGQCVEDLEQVAALALIKAVDGFDPQRGKPFFGYLLPTVLGELKRHFRDKTWDVHVTRQMQERHLELTRTRAALTQRLKRPPQIGELGLALGFSDKEVLDVLAAGAVYDVDSLNARVTPDDDSCERQDLIGAEDPRLASACDRLAVRGLLHRLPERERFIVTMYYFRGATQDQIAGMLGMSQMNVSRLLRRAIERLRCQLDGQPEPTKPQAASVEIVMFDTGRHGVIIGVRGTVDDAGAGRLRAALVDTAVQRRPRHITVDLRRARFIGGRATRALVDGYRACGPGVRLAVVNASQELYGVLCRLGVTRLFPCASLDHHEDVASVERRAGPTCGTADGSLPAPWRRRPATTAVHPHPAQPSAPAGRRWTRRPRPAGPRTPMLCIRGWATAPSWLASVSLAPSGTVEAALRHTGHSRQRSARWRAPRLQPRAP